MTFQPLQKKVLVCDDHPLLLSLLTERLVHSGFRVVEASNGSEALSALRSQRIDAVILDSMMPDIDGYRVLCEIKADPALASIPVIMLTARSEETDIVSALAAGASDYVVKPFIPEELLMRLMRLISPERLPNYSYVSPSSATPHPIGGASRSLDTVIS